MLVTDLVRLENRHLWAWIIRPGPTVPHVRDERPTTAQRLPNHNLAGVVILESVKDCDEVT